MYRIDDAFGRAARATNNYGACKFVGLATSYRFAVCVCLPAILYKENPGKSVIDYRVEFVTAKKIQGSS